MAVSAWDMIGFQCSAPTSAQCARAKSESKKVAPRHEHDRAPRNTTWHCAAPLVSMNRKSGAGASPYRVVPRCEV
uniref:Uncharacterized protein n=1 Tax=Romanomermis culicivorax TaxID=13658 RepID=A0A915JT74_ROMCU